MLTPSWELIRIYIEVYCCSGQLLCSFQDPDLWADPSVAHLTGSRAAISSWTTFDIENGILLSTAGPGNDTDGSGASVIAANRACSKLIFCPGNSAALYVYNAVSLELMHTLLPEADCVSQILALACPDPFPGALLGVYGLLLMQDIHHQDRVRHMEILQPEAGGGSYGVVSLSQNMGPEELAASSCSPCGAYICTVVKPVLGFQVHDMRSGRLVLRCMIPPASMGHAEARLHHDATMHWSSCGRRVMVVVSARTCSGPAFHCERLFIMTIY